MTKPEDISTGSPASAKRVYVGPKSKSKKRNRATIKLRPRQPQRARGRDGQY